LAEQYELGESKEGVAMPMLMVGKHEYRGKSLRLVKPGEQPGKNPVVPEL